MLQLHVARHGLSRLQNQNPSVNRHLSRVTAKITHPVRARSPAPAFQRFSISAFPWDAWDGFGTLLGRYFNAKTSVNSGLGRWDGIFSPPVRALSPAQHPSIHHPPSTILRPGTVGITPANPPIGLDRSGLLRHRQPKIRTHPDLSGPIRTHPDRKLLF